MPKRNAAGDRKTPSAHPAPASGTGRPDHRWIALTASLLVVGTAGATSAEAQHRTYRGSGDDVVRIEKPRVGQPALLAIQGNAAGRHFAVTAYTAERRRVGLLVNTADRYSGIVPVDLPPRQETAILEVNATGSWSIEVHPIGAARSVNVPGSASGSGDQVLWVDGHPTTARISGNREGRHFAVTAFDQYGRRQGLVVNTADPYEGTVMLPRGVRLLEVTAAQSWSIRLR